MIQNEPQDEFGQWNDPTQQTKIQNSTTQQGIPLFDDFLNPIHEQGQKNQPDFSLSLNQQKKEDFNLMPNFNLEVQTPIDGKNKEIEIQESTFTQQSKDTQPEITEDVWQFSTPQTQLQQIKNDQKQPQFSEFYEANNEEVKIQQKQESQPNTQDIQKAQKNSNELSIKPDSVKSIPANFQLQNQREEEDIWNMEKGVGFASKQQNEESKRIDEDEADDFGEFVTVSQQNQQLNSLLQVSKPFTNPKVQKEAISKNEDEEFGQFQGGNQPQIQVGSHAGFINSLPDYSVLLLGQKMIK